jgi:hypothetical protein
MINVFSTRSYISKPSLILVNSLLSWIITYYRRLKDKYEGEAIVLGKSISAIKATITVIVYLDVYSCEILISYYRNRGGSRGGVYSIRYFIILLYILLARDFCISEPLAFLLVFRGIVPILLTVLLLLFSLSSRPCDLLH